MENCLVTTLKGSADNNNLERLGAVKLVLDAISGVSIPINVNNSKSFYAEIVGNGHFCDNNGTTDYGQSKEYNAGGVVIRIKDASEGDLLYLYEKYTLVYISCSGSGTAFKSASPAKFDFCNALIILNFSSNGYPAYNINDITKYAVGLSNITNQYNPNITGDIETAVENLIGLGRNSGTLAIKAYKAKITVNDVAIFDVYDDRTETLTITFGQNSATVVWKGSTIASYDGTDWTYPSE